MAFIPASQEPFVVVGHNNIYLLLLRYRQKGVDSNSKAPQSGDGDSVGGWSRSVSVTGVWKASTAFLFFFKVQPMELLV